MRSLAVRPVVFPSAAVLLLLCSLLTAACSSAGEKPQTNNTTSNAPAAASANRPAGNTTAVNNNAGQGIGQAKLNLNTATEDEFLAGVPGLGKRMAHEFEEYRPYRSVQQFRREMSKYVKPEQIAEYEKYVFVPIAENEADAATLQQLPGLDATEAEALVAGRPYASRDAFLTKLAEKVSADELALAKTYLGSK